MRKLKFNTLIGIGIFFFISICGELLTFHRGNPVCLVVEEEVYRKMRNEWCSRNGVTKARKEDPTSFLLIPSSIWMSQNSSII
jgi:hypothetical protein